METARTRDELIAAVVEDDLATRAKHFRSGVWPYRHWSAAEFWSWQRADRDAFIERREACRLANSRLHVRPLSIW